MTARDLTRVAALLLTLAVGLGGAGEAEAHCNPALLCPNPGPGACTITVATAPNNKIDNGCVLDFGDRPVTLSGTLDIDGNAVVIRAREFIITSNGLIDGNGLQGGLITIIATGGNIVVQSSTQKGIDVGGQNQGGTIELHAMTGNATIDGRLKANNGNNSPDADGGGIRLLTGGKLAIRLGSDVDASGGRDANGGVLDFKAGGDIDITADVMVHGGEGGDAGLEAGEKILLNGRIIADSTAGGGGGGFVDIAAGKTITVGGAIQSKGSRTSDNQGGDGGLVAIGSTHGDVIVRAEIMAQSGEPNGGGGEIELSAGRSVLVQAGRVNARGEGADSDGGSIVIDSDLDVIVGAGLDASGGNSGSEIEIAAGRHVEIANLLDVRGRQLGTFAGNVFVEAGVLEGGDVTVKAGATQPQAGRILASGAACLPGGVCSFGGTIEINGCNVTVEGKPTIGSPVVAGMLDVSAEGAGGFGGDIAVVARRHLTVGIGGTIDAGGRGGNGSIELVYPQDLQNPVLGDSLIRPFPPSFIECTEANCPQGNACPSGDAVCRACRPLCSQFCGCGDGMLDEFEQCDRPDTGTCNVGAGQVCGVTGTVRECLCIATCGNDQVDGGEECDGAGNGSTCRALGFYDPDEPATTVPCATCAFDTSMCDVGECGDDVLAPRNELDEKGLSGSFEVCDGADVGLDSCVSRGFTRGTLACKTDCSGFDITGCEIGFCGDNVVDPGEECDAGNANSNAPNAPCRLGCLLPRCGDNVVDPGEQCDDGNQNNNDSCLTGCLAATCGDGLLCSAAGCTSGLNGVPEQCDESATCCLSTCVPRTCPDGLACDDLGSNGCCHPADCNDGNVCTDDTCTPTLGCTSTLRVGCCTGTGAPCNDGNACTTNDTCTDLNTCGGTPAACVSSNPCQTPTGCNPQTGCQFQPIPGCCTKDADCAADASACTTERCDLTAHTCVSEQIQCTTTDACLEVRGCDPQAGCQTARVKGIVGLDCLMARELLALTAEVPAKEPDLGKKLVKQLGKFLKKATKKIEKGRKLAADPKKAAKATKQLTAADKQLAKFLAKLNAVDPAVAAPLADLVEFIREQLAGALS